MTVHFWPGVIYPISLSVSFVSEQRGSIDDIGGERKRERERKRSEKWGKFAKKKLQPRKKNIKISPILRFKIGFSSKNIDIINSKSAEALALMTHFLFSQILMHKFANIHQHSCKTKWENHWDYVYLTIDKFARIDFRWYLH